MYFKRKPWNTICKRLFHDRISWFSFEIHSEIDIQFLSRWFPARGPMAEKTPLPRSHHHWVHSGEVLPTSLEEMVMGPLSQGWWLVLWVWTRVRLSREAWHLGEDKCKQWWLHGTECHEITEEKIHPSGRVRQRRWSGGTGQVGLSTGSLGSDRWLRWGVGKEFQVQGRQRNRNNKVEYFNNDLAFGLYYVNLKLFVHRFVNVPWRKKKKTVQ